MKRSNHISNNCYCFQSDYPSKNITLPHLEVFRSNVLKGKTNGMKLSIGSVALMLQPKLRVVESDRNWNTYDAIAYILDMESKYKVSLSTYN